MTPFLLSLLAITAALGCGLIAGTFFAFSCFVMRALARLPAANGIAAMQSINIVVLNPLFLGVFLGTGALCALLGVWSVWNWSQAGSTWIIVGSALYLVGNIMVTGACNIPRNNALAALDPASPPAAGYWADYLSSWTAWNHVRTATAAGALVLLIVGLIASHTSA